MKFEGDAGGSSHQFSKHRSIALVHAKNPSNELDEDGDEDGQDPTRPHQNQLSSVKRKLPVWSQSEIKDWTESCPERQGDATIGEGLGWTRRVQRPKGLESYSMASLETHIIIGAGKFGDRRHELQSFALRSWDLSESASVHENAPLLSGFLRKGRPKILY